MGRAWMQEVFANEVLPTAVACELCCHFAQTLVHCIHTMSFSKVSALFQSPSHHLVWTSVQEEEDLNNTQRVLLAEALCEMLDTVVVQRWMDQVSLRKMHRVQRQVDSFHTDVPFDFRCVRQARTLACFLCLQSQNVISAEQHLMRLSEHTRNIDTSTLTQQEIQTETVLSYRVSDRIVERDCVM